MTTAEEPLVSPYDIPLDPDDDDADWQEPAYVDPPEPAAQSVPVIPPSWRGWANIRATVRAGLSYYGRVAAVHAVRSPKYALLLAFWAVVGAGKLTWRVLRWVGDPDGRPSREDRADGLDSWRRQREDHHLHVKHRLVGLAIGVVALVAAGALLRLLAPWWVEALIVAVAVPALAAFGKPAGRRIVTRAVVTPRVRRINADIVLRAYYAAGLGHPDKPDQQVTFGSQIARDRGGSGSYVMVDLPYGKGFSDALKKRESIASGLDVSVNQVYIARDPTSSRRHRLFVADRDPLAIPAGRTPLLKLRATDIWQPAPLGLDERGQKVGLELMWNSLLVGAQPRKGKTWSARLLALYAALDPYVRITLVDGKGSPDWRGFTRVADRTIFGLNISRDGDPVEILVHTLRAILTDVRQRYERLSAMPVDRVPEGKLTPELSRDLSVGMPVHLLILEEVQEYLETPDQAAAKEIAKLLVSLVKIGPAAGLIIMTSTQKPSGVGSGDVAKLFTSFRDQHSVRFALRCGSRHVSEAVLGGDAYGEGYDASAIPVGKEYRGVGILYGASDDTPMVRTYLADGDDAERILTTARRLREAAGTLSGTAAGDDTGVPPRDILADVLAVWPAGAPGVHWVDLAALLTGLAPDAYPDATGESVSARLRALGVPSTDVKAGGVTRKGCRLDAVRGALARAG